MAGTHYEKKTEFSALQIYRIYKMTMEIALGLHVDTRRFDTIIDCIDRINPNLTFDELYHYCKIYEIDFVDIRHDISYMKFYTGV